MTTELIAECKAIAGQNSLSIKILHSGNAYMCERKEVERDGTVSIQLLPFSAAHTLQAFIKSDSFYKEHSRTLDKMASAIGRYLHE